MNNLKFCIYQKFSCISSSGLLSGFSFGVIMAMITCAIFFSDTLMYDWNFGKKFGQNFVSVLAHESIVTRKLSETASQNILSLRSIHHYVLKT